MTGLRGRLVVVTGAGGLALMGGMLLLGQAAGSFELTEILERGDQVAVVTGTGEQKGDVTLAVRSKGKKAWVVVGGWWPSLGAKGKPDLGGRQHVLLIGSDARTGQKMSRARASSPARPARARFGDGPASNGGFFGAYRLTVSG